jgi:hypothetical protein
MLQDSLVAVWDLPPRPTTKIPIPIAAKVEPKPESHIEIWRAK